MIRSLLLILKPKFVTIRSPCKWLMEKMNGVPSSGIHESNWSKLDPGLHKWGFSLNSNLAFIPDGYIKQIYLNEIDSLKCVLSIVISQPKRAKKTTDLHHQLCS